MAARALIAIVGETASGKSELALRIAQKYDGELICADSWTVYKGFDIGTAKPKTADKELVPHHLLDVADPRKGFSAALFKQLANEATTDISARGKLPILVGGTGLYIDSVIFDYGFLPKGDKTRRDLLNKLSLQELLQQASELNISLEGIDVRNKRRVIRAIETNGQRPASQALRANTLVLGKNIERHNLQSKIEQRVDTMLAEGLEQEVKDLAKTYGWDVEPMKGIGYREWQDYFSGTQTLDVTRERIVRASLGLAKRQRTWFKRNQKIQWCNSTEQAEMLVHDFLNTILLQ